ncbi:MAG: hypothetical protein Q7J70_07180 [Thermodesulfovibrionales bacterium]|nr:hypothetical protein [Thermodesulfovibrionales bacterium]
MSDKNLMPMGSKSFEDLKKVNEPSYHFAGAGKVIEGRKEAIMVSAPANHDIEHITHCDILRSQCGASSLEKK